MHNIKRTLATLLVLVMMVAMLGAMSVSATETGYVAGLGLTASDWSVSTGFGVDATVQTTVTGDGTYTLKYEGACLDLGILVVDIVGAQADLDANNQTYEVTELKLTVDGAEVPVDLSKVLAGDLEANGNFRIDLYNMYGDSKNDPSLDNTTTVAESLELTFTIATVDKAAEGAGEVITEVPEEFDLFIAYGGDKAAENDWAWGYTGTDVEGITATTAKIKVGETQTVSLTFDGGNVNSWYFAPCLVAPGAGTAITAIDFTVTCKIDGADVAIDMAANPDGTTWWAEATGDHAIENCVRLAGGYNEWATQYIPEPAGFTTIEYTVTLNSVSGGEAPAEEEAAPSVVFDPNGSYNAYLGVQTPNWTYRDAWNSANGIGSDYWGDFIYGNETSEKYGKVTDAVIAGNGTYTVSVTDFGTVFADDFNTAGQEYFNLLYVSTDIPRSDDVTISDVKLIIDGKTVHTYDEAFLDEDEVDYFKVLIQNIWNADVAEISYYPAPSKSLEMQFTVSGFAYDNESQAVEETEPATEPATEAPATEEPAESGSATGIIIAVVAVVAVVAVGAVVVLKKKKAQ